MEESDIKSIENTLKIIEGKWKIRIILNLDKNSLNFTSLNNQISDISNKVLSNNLEKLKEDGLIKKNDKKYEITVRGKEYIEIMEKARSWGLKHLSGVSQIKVLIIEDDESQAEVYKRWMPDNCKVVIANRLSEAFNVLEQDFDLVILDMNLQGASGDKIIGMSGRINAYLAVISGMNKSEGRKLEGIDEFIQKPVSRHEIEELLRKWRA